MKEIIDLTLKITTGPTGSMTLKVQHIYVGEKEKRIKTKWRQI